MTAQFPATLVREDTVKKITEFLGSDLEQVRRLLRQTVDSESRLIREVGDYIALSHGKMLRPMLTLLTARALSPAATPPVGLAAALELIHVATLIHDDVIDHATLRRGQPSVNARWGDDVAVLMADYLYSRAFDLALMASRPEPLRLICQAAQKMCEGEMFQIEWRDQEINAQDYLRVVERKTGHLFSACSALGAMAAGRPESEISSARRFGLAFGIAFQITDDTLDFIAHDERWGKDLGMDISGGKQTLPLLLAMADASEEDRALMEKWLNNGRDFNSILGTIQRYRGVERALEEAKKFADRALEHLSALSLTDATAGEFLSSLPLYVINRDY